MAPPNPNVYWTDDRLIQLFESARAGSPEVREQLDKLERARRQRVIAALRTHHNRVAEATRAELAVYDDSLQALAAAEREADAEPVSIPYRWGIPNRLATWALYAVFMAVTVWLISGFFVGWRTPWSWLFQQAGWWGIGALFAAIIGLFFLASWLSTRIESLTSAARRQARQSRSVDERQREVKATEEELQKVGEQAALRSWRGLISSELKPLYSVEMKATRASAEEIGTEREMQVMTPAHDKLAAKLVDMRGGSIGIAGPRGAGKSTLMAWFCSNDATIADKLPTLAVALSAPVEYEARDFLLHLFASLCHRALEKADQRYGPHNWKKQFTQVAPHNGDIWQLLLAGAAAALFVGAMLAVTGIVWSIDVAEASADTRSAPAATPAAPAKPASGASATAAAAPASPRPSSAPASSASAAAAATAASAPASAASAAAASASAPNAAATRSAARELGLSPAVLFAVSLPLMLGAGVMLALLATVAARNPPPVRVQAASQAAGHDPEPGRWFPKVLRQPATWYRDVRAGLGPLDPVKASSPIAEAALFWLAEIKFQQSYSTGWSGALKMPIGVEGGMTQARSMAQQQLSLPEIADAIAGFLRTLARHYTVVVGIDELDKIESDEKAQKFLNDIKVVFGGVNVFFLVSVSENAMSHFERRGLPFRDAFDSAFEDIVVVNHLKFEVAQRLINERVLRMPRQFQALCHVLSAGLPRELVRTTRDLVLAVNGSTTPAGRELEAVAQGLVADELSSKVLAYTAAAGRLPATPARDTFMLLLDHAASAPPEANQLLGLHEELLKLVATAGHTSRRRPAPEPDPLKALAEEVATYFYFLSVVCTVFVNSLNAIEMAKLEKEAIDALARVRGIQERNQALARRMLGELKERLARTPPPNAAP